MNSPPLHPYPDGELPADEATALVRAAIEAPEALDPATVRALALHNQAMNRRIERQAMMLDRIRESVITMDLLGFITGWNKGAEQMFGYTAEEAIGRNILFLYDQSEEGDAGGLELEDAFLEHGGREMEVRRRKKSGELFWASLLLSAVRDDDGDPTGLIGYLHDITERKQTEEQINVLAYHDPLTGLANRTLLFRLVDQALEVARRNDMSGALLFIDLNRFKPINDTLGHTVGDRLLVEIAERLRATLRAEDVVARIGGDEFVVGLIDIARTDHASLVAQKILAAINEPVFIDSHELRIGAAIGISLYPRDGNDVEALLAAADIAMYRAKQGHGGDESYAFYAEDMNARAAERLRLESELRRAIAHDELLLHYQPKVAIADGRIVGAEALVRWRHPERGMVPPGDFIPVAEESGLILQVSEWVLEAACAQSRSWQDAGLAPLKVAINLSAREFNPKLPGRIRAALARHGLPPSRLDLEITEGMLMHSTEAVIAMMAELAAMGVSLSLDDFGTGYSSLSYLRRFPIQSLKIDRSFVIDLPDDANAGAIASAIVSMSKRLQHRVVAEGVETLAQLQFLESHGCDEIQGYFFSPPLPADKFEALVREDRRLQP